MENLVPPGVLGLDCLTCTAKTSNPLRCTRPEHDGTYKTCQQGTTHCFKSVDRTTKGKKVPLITTRLIIIIPEVNKGCVRPGDLVLGTKTSTEQEMFLCTEQLCNTASLLSFPALLLSVSSLLAALVL